MKMKVYWVANPIRDVPGETFSVNGKRVTRQQFLDANFIALAGPYPTFDDAAYAKDLHFTSRPDATVVRQLVEIEAEMVTA